MTAYLATRAQPGIMPVYLYEGVTAVYSEFSLSAALTTADTIQLCTIPAFVTMIDVILATDELDTNGTAAITYSVGDAGAAGRFILAAAQSNGIALPPTHMNVAAGLGFQYTANTPLLLSVAHNPGTGATTGKIRFVALYSANAITATSDGSELP